MDFFSQIWVWTIVLACIVGLLAQKLLLRFMAVIAAAIVAIPVTVMTWQWLNLVTAGWVKLWPAFVPYQCLPWIIGTAIAVSGAAFVVYWLSKPRLPSIPLEDE